MNKDHHQRDSSISTSGVKSGDDYEQTKDVDVGLGVILDLGFSILIA